MAKKKLPEELRKRAEAMKKKAKKAEKFEERQEKAAKGKSIPEGKQIKPKKVLNGNKGSSGGAKSGKSKAAPAKKKRG